MPAQPVPGSPGTCPKFYWDLSQVLPGVGIQKRGLGMACKHSFKGDVVSIFTVCSIFEESPHPLDEKAVGRRMQLLTFATREPFCSDAARACCQAGSAWNAAQLFSRSPRLG